MSTEAQKKAHRKYYLSHKEYYREKSKEGMRRVYKERKDYKNRCEETLGYLKYQLEYLDIYEDTKARMLCAMAIALLEGDIEK